MNNLPLKKRHQIHIEPNRSSCDSCIYCGGQNGNREMFSWICKLTNSMGDGCGCLMWFSVTYGIETIERARRENV